MKRHQQQFSLWLSVRHRILPKKKVKFLSLQEAEVEMCSFKLMLENILTILAMLSELPSFICITDILQ